MGGITIASAALMAEWAFIHIVAGLLTFGPAIGGDLALFHERVYAKMKGHPKARAFSEMQRAGSPCNDDGKGYPFLLHRVFIQHSINLFFVGVQAVVAVAACAKSAATRPRRTLRNSG